MSSSEAATDYLKLFHYYEREQFLPTFGNFESQAKLAEYAAARRVFFEEKLMLPVQLFNRARLLEFGPDSGENALVFAQWGANLTLSEPNARARGQIRSYFERFGLNDRLLRLRDDDVEGFSSDESYDVIDAEGFIHTVQPTSLWLKVFGHHVRPGGHVIVSYYERHGGFLELVLRAIHAAYKALTSLPGEAAAQALYRAKWDSIPHTRTFGSWVGDVLENPFCRLHNFIDSAAICRDADLHGFDLHASWPLYRDPLDIYWHKRVLSPADTLRKNTAHLHRSPVSFLSGQKMYLAGSADDVEAINNLTAALLTHLDGIIDDPFGDRLAAFRLGLKALRQSVRTANVLVDAQASLDGFDVLVEALEEIFHAVASGNGSEIARLTSSNPAFIAAWGMPNHFLVLRKRPEAPAEQN